MIISTRGRYALRVLIDLAGENSDEYIPMKNVAERQGISLKYLEQILPSLKKNKLIEGIHGKGGGYKLCRKPEEYTVGEVLRITEGEITSVACLKCDAKKCERADICKTLPMWKGLNDIIHDYFDNITVKDLIDGKLPNIIEKK